jgi:hypothetical protein
MDEFFRSGDMLGSGSQFSESGCLSFPTEANFWLVSWDSVKHSMEELEFCFLGLNILSLLITASPAESKPFSHVFMGTSIFDNMQKNSVFFS